MTELVYPITTHLLFSHITDVITHYRSLLIVTLVLLLSSMMLNTVENMFSHMLANSLFLYCIYI